MEETGAKLENYAVKDKNLNQKSNIHKLIVSPLTCLMSSRRSNVP